MSRIILNPQNSNELVVHSGRRIQCEQIFQRASSINKDLINRMQNSQIARKHVFGLEINKIWILITLLFLFSFSFIGTILFWFTDTFDSIVMDNLMLVNGSQMYEGWAQPKVKTLIKMHIFNYTNVEAFETGQDTKLHVKDLGPYVYEEIIERHNIHFESDGTVTFQDVYKHKFMPHLSKGKQSDLVVVPNIMVFSAAQKTEGMDYWTRVAASMTLGGFMNKKPFMKIAAHRFIWGYDDSVYDLAKGFMAMQHGNMQEQVGLFAQRNGTSPHILSIHTGQKGMQDYGLISKIDGFDSINYWSTEECNSVSASEGVLFPPQSIRAKQDLLVYNPDMCRKFQYNFEKEVHIINGTVPAYRYILPESVFDAPDKVPSNQCYCDMNTGACSPQGFYGLGACAFGAPLYMSLPHFKSVDPSYIKVDGISPNSRDLSSYVHIHPTMGFTLSGMTRFQINVLGKSYKGFYSMDMFNEDVMLPLAWFEAGLEDNHMSKEYLDSIYYTSLTVPQMEMAAKYITFLTALITVTAIIIIIRGNIKKYRENITLAASTTTGQRLNV